MSFDRLIRFEADDGKTYYGDLTEELPAQEIEGKAVMVLEGSVDKEFKKTGMEKKVVKLLCPLERTPMVVCVGLNYRQHAEECNLQVPSYPAIFTKPADALTSPTADIPIPAPCQSQLDYEGELTLVIGRDCKNIRAADATSYLLGYTIGNDVSARNFQMPASVSGGQFCYAKSFDSFAPVGPCIASPALIEKLGGDKNLKLWTKVNGEIRQETKTDDMIFGIGEVLEHLSRGTTLRKGTVVMTGTPSGVGLFREPKGFVGDGDVVEVGVEGVGSLRNRMVFEKE